MIWIKIGKTMEKLKTFLIEAKTRIITALALIAVACLIVAIDSEFLTWAVLGLVYLMSFHEVCKLLDIEQTKLYGIAIAIWIICGVFATPLLVVCVALIILVSIMLQKGDFDFKILLPFLYPTIPMALFLTLYIFFGMEAIVWLIIIVASTDVGAYVIGKFMGKTPFSNISPNKTWEGVTGGIVIGMLLGTIAGMYVFTFWTALTISLATSTASIWGDLFESYLKRRADVKDSGNIFPGHGGVLDRVDGYFFGVIVMLTLLEGLI